MGVQGLWSVLHCTGRDIDLSSLDGKVLAIDLSIWLNQALKSGIDSPNIHLEILFRRVCKLLFYNIKPVFVFDGPSPSLKKETILIRRKRRQMMQNKCENIKRNIVHLLMKKKITQKRNPSKEEKSDSNDLFKLPRNEYFDSMLMNTSDMDSGFSDIAHDYLINIPSKKEINFESESFLSMPLEVQHEIIRHVAKEKRYGYDTSHNSFDQKTGQDFSQLQIQNLLNRNKLQQKVDNLRTSMNYRNNQNLISSLGCKHMNKLSPNEVHSKKILSHKEAYLMMIDPTESDLVDSLTKLKRQYMFKNINSNKPLQTFQNDDINKEKEILFESNESDFGSQVFQTKDEIENVNKEILRNCDIMLNKKSSITEDVSKFNYNSDHDKYSGLDMDNIFDKAEINKECIVNEKEETEKNDFSKTNEDKVLYVEEVSDFSKSDETKEYHRFQKSPMLDQVTQVISDNLLTSLITRNEENEKVNDPVKRLFCYEDFTENILSFDEENKINFENSTKENKEEQHKNDVANESDDDFIDVPEMEMGKEDAEDTDTFSDTDIVMLLTDPEEWQRQIDETIDSLEKEERKIESQAISMSERYYEEAKDLLKLFGIPYLESPGEAEAQCAFLENAKLTDGTVTEDSDIWLFGGRLVYKHMFSRDHSVRAYNQEFIFQQLGLSRDLMICIALLSGSDYAPGIHGIGPVIAMEILAEFSDRDVDQTHFQVLESFKKWHDNYSNDPSSYSGNSDRKRFLRFSLDTNFLNAKVIEAYNRPLVNDSTEPFMWSQPSIDKLLEFAETKIGWSKLKVLEMLKIVINRKTEPSKINKRTILDYFSNSAVDRLLNSKKSPSKRLKLATKQRNIFSTNIRKLKK